MFHALSTKPLPFVPNASKKAQACGADGRVPLLFHIVDFNNGGIETSLIQWLRVFDRARFTVTLSVMHPSPAFETQFRALVPDDVKIEILADKSWLNFFQARRYAHRLSKLGRIGRDVFNTLAVRPYVKRRLAQLTRRHALIVDFDLSLRRLAGRFDTAWLGRQSLQLRRAARDAVRALRRHRRAQPAYGRRGARDVRRHAQARVRTAECNRHRAHPR